MHLIGLMLCQVDIIGTIELGDVILCGDWI